MDNNDKCTKASIYSSPQLSNSLIPYRYWLQIYMVAVTFSNLLLLFWDSSVDLGFWENWTQQLATKGYHEFNGNYPPIYIHWLYIVGQIYLQLDIPIEKNILLKYLTQLPVLLAHLLFTGIIFDILKKTCARPVHFHAAMLLTALNPAVLFNGPIWGQIDIIPVIPVIAALFAGVSRRWKTYTFPLYILALLTKFQMIAFAPVFGILFFVDYKSHLKSIALCLAILIIAFTPFIAADNFFATIKRAYVDTLNIGATTMGASNIWIPLTGNAAPDTIVLFDTHGNRFFEILFKAKNFGIISFSLMCLAIFLKGTKNVINKKYVNNQNALTSDSLFYAMICSAAFFTLLPAMHERYLLPAVLMSLVCFAVNPQRIFYSLAFSFISAFNLAMCMGIKTSAGVWPIVSWLMLAAFSYGLMELIYKRTWNIFIKDITSTIFSFKGTFALFFVIANAFLANYLLETTRIHKVNLAANQIALNRIHPYSAHQDYGTLNIDKSVNGTMLTVAGRRFADGLGTHANSQIDYMIPNTSQEFSFIVGIDDEIESASVKFSVWGDDKLLWESKPYYGAEKDLVPIKLPVENIEKLSLRVSDMGNANNDHADWIQPIVTLRKE